MAYKQNRTIDMPAPYLRRVWLDAERIEDRAAYPFCLPFLNDEFELSFDRPITIIVGENGAGKSTLLEGIAVLAGFDDAGGGKGHRPVDHSQAIETMGGELSEALRASWLPPRPHGAWDLSEPNTPDSCLDGDYLTSRGQYLDAPSNDR